jgi:hypothetical protein
MGTASRIRKLPRRHSSAVAKWQEPVAYTADHRRELAADLALDAVEALVRACSEAKTMHAFAQSMPTSGEVRESLREVADLAERLAGKLARSDAWTDAEMATAGLSVAGNMRHHVELAGALLAFATACDKRIDAQPAQSRREAPVWALRPIERVCTAHGIKFSTAPSSKFLRIARTCFAAMGLESPEQAARNLKAEMMRTAPGKD